MNKWPKGWLVNLTAFVLGLSLALAFAPFEIYPLAVIAPAGLLGLMLKTTPSRAHWLGFIFGLGFFGAGIYWVFISIHEFGAVPPVVAGLITGGLVAILALFPAFVCSLTNRYYPVNNTAKLVYAFPAIWLISEWIRSWIGCGFPWLLLGYTQTNSPLKGYAPIFSVYGASLAALMCSGLFVNAFLQFRQKKFQSLYLNLLAVMAIWVIGALLNLIPWTNKTGTPITVSLVQGNIPQSLKWSPTHLSLSLERYATLTQPLWKKSEIIVWPEAAVPMTLQSAAEFIDAMDEKARTHHTHLILGIPVQDPKSAGYYNAVISLGNDKATYLKRRLVPFGEYVPFQQLSSHVLNFMNIPMSDMLAGNPNQAPLQIGSTKINTSICFEIAFPELINMRDETVGMLLTVTNDAWFGKSSAQSQHLQMAAMRAIELGRPVLLASNDGLTAIIGPNGRIESEAPSHVPFVLTGTVQPMSGLTPWMTNGLDPLLAILLCFLFGAKRFNRLKKHTDIQQAGHNGRAI